MNIWLTPMEARGQGSDAEDSAAVLRCNRDCFCFIASVCISAGGGLEIYKLSPKPALDFDGLPSRTAPRHVPRKGTWTADFNRVGIPD